MMDTDVWDCVTNIQVMGIGTGGYAMANTLLDVMPDVPLICVHSDTHTLQCSRAARQLWLASGADALQEAQVAVALANTHLLFIAADITTPSDLRALACVARMARTLDILMVGVALPAATGATHLPAQAWHAHVDALLVIAPEEVHRTLQCAVQEVAAIVNEYGNVNVDFEDVRTVLSMRGLARIGSACATGPNRAQAAAQQAIEGMNLGQAQGLLMLVSAAKGSLRLSESRQAMHIANAGLPTSAHVIFGAAYDDALGDQLRVTVIAAGVPSAV